MLLLLCLLLSCWAPSCPSPLPLDKDCPSTSSLSEVIEDVEKLQVRLFCLFGFCFCTPEFLFWWSIF